MADDDGSDDLYTPAQWIEWAEGHGHRDPDEAHRHAAHVRDEQVSRYLSWMKTHYDPTEANEPSQMPGQAKDLRRVREIQAIEGTETARTAYEGGDMQTLKAFTGDQGQRADVSGIKAIGAVDDLVTGPAPVVVVLGRMGAGKSNFANLLGQRYKHHNPEALVGSNIRSLEQKTPWVNDDGEMRDGWIPSYPALTDWVEQDGDPLEHEQRAKLFIGDEFSSGASGRGKEGFKTAQKMGPFVFKIRKYGGALIYIGHGPKSIHPILWRVGTIVKKISQKKAIIANEIRNARVADVEETIEGIPPTDWQYNDKEASSWSWHRASADDEDAEIDASTAKAVAMWTIKECMEDGLSPRETANFVPYSHTTVSNWWEDHEEGGEKRQWVAHVEEVIG